MKKTIFLTAVFSFLILFANAQDEQHKARWEKYRSEKISFLTDKMEMSPAEAQKFWPVYNELEKMRWEAQKTRRDLEMKVNDTKATLSKKEATQLTRDFTGSMEKEGALLVKYNEEFLKILPPEKVLKLYQAENEFRMYMIQKFRDREPKKE
ncbi:MAG: hypothetical protein EOM73_07375 [Bacteroidia bacterium]|nr:hypothetical protein [Bacteroidia bacterium]